MPRDYPVNVSKMGEKGKIKGKLTCTKWWHPRAMRLMRVRKGIRPSWPSIGIS